MAARGFEMCLGLVLALMLWHEARAQSGCTNAILSLSPCLNYVTGNTSIPSQGCCSQLDGVVKSTPQCLCSLMNGAGISMGISINQTLALRLPGALPFISQLLLMDQQTLQHSPQKLSLHLHLVLQKMALMNPQVLPQHKVQPFPQVLNRIWLVWFKPGVACRECKEIICIYINYFWVRNVYPGTGSKSVPSTNTNASAGNHKKPFQLSTVILFIAAAASILINLWTFQQAFMLDIVL